MYDPRLLISLLRPEVKSRLCASGVSYARPKRFLLISVASVQPLLWVCFVPATSHHCVILCWLKYLREQAPKASGLTYLKTNDFRDERVLDWLYWKECKELDELYWKQCKQSDPAYGTVLKTMQATVSCLSAEWMSFRSHRMCGRFLRIAVSVWLLLHPFSSAWRCLYLVTEWARLISSDHSVLRNYDSLSTLSSNEILYDATTQVKLGSIGLYSRVILCATVSKRKRTHHSVVRKYDSLLMSSVIWGPLPGQPMRISYALATKISVVCLYELHRLILFQGCDSTILHFRLLWRKYSFAFQQDEHWRDTC